MASARGMHSFNSGLYYASYDVLTTGSPTWQPAVPNYTNIIQIVNNDPTWQEVADVVSVNGVSNERSVTQLTHLRSPGKAHEKVPGFLDAGQITVRLNSRKSLLVAIQALMPGATGTEDAVVNGSPRWGRRSWALYFPDNGVCLFHGFIKSDPVEIPEDNRITIDLNIEISGKPTYLAFD